MKIAVDAMGGDFAPHVAVKGALHAAGLFEDTDIILVGDEKSLKNICAGLSSSLPKNISFRNASEVIHMDESPVIALRRKKDSSISVAANLVKENYAEALVTAGSTGAAVAATTLKWRLLPGIDRSGIALPFPHAKGVSVLLDAGANIECKPINFYQYAVMGKIYSQAILNKKNVSIGLLNIGEEESKGSDNLKEIFSLFKNAYFNFIGNVEGRDIFNGRCDVIVCDGFVGNIVLKVAEGVVGTLTELATKELKATPLSLLGALFSRSAFRRLKKRVDYSEYGGAPLLGVKGICIIAHGSSNEIAMFNAIRVARDFARYDVNKMIMKEIEEYAIV